MTLPTPNRCRPLPAALALLSACLALNADPAGPSPSQSPTDSPPVAEVDFLRDVRPILSGHCFKCHGPDDAARKSRLRLDTHEGALAPARSGYPAIVPHNTSESELVRRITTEEEQDMMPPPAAKLELSAAQKQILIRWIEQGADYQPHWAFIKPVPKPLPSVRDTTWPRNEIDTFVLARMEEQGLAPSEPADPYTLVRRVHLDLIGLPPDPATSEAFARDPSPEAYERMVDELLASPHYGERWARRWMDLARYADTNGYEKDRPRSIWPWRDWVINALNADMPFDQFTIEQIAGDLLPNPTLDQRIATGFHRNAMLNEEGGIDPLEYRFLAMVDRVHVTATTWLGLTMACAQCHTHKYDPIQQRDYYRFMALMNNADEPWIEVPQPDIAQRRDEQLEQLAKLKAELPLLFPPDLRVDWLTPARSRFSSRAGASAEQETDGSWLVSGPQAEKDSYEITLDTTLERITHLQLEVLTHPDLPSTGPGLGENGDFVLSEITMTAAPLESSGDTQTVQFAKATADAWKDDFQPRKSIDSKSGTGWAINDAGEGHVPHALTLTLSEPVGFVGGTRLTVTLHHEHGSRRALGKFRISLGRELPDPRPLEVRRQERLNREVTRWLDREVPRVVNWFRLRPTTATGSVPTLSIEDDDSVFASGDFTKRDVYSLEMEGDWKGVRALRLEAIPDDRLPDGGPGRVAYEGPIGDFWLSDLKVYVGTNTHKLTRATESYASGDDTAAKALDDDLQSGWSIKGAQGQRHNAVFQLDPPLDHEGTLRIEMTFERYYAAALGRFRFWATRDENAVALSHPFDIQQRLLILKQARAIDSNATPSEEDLRHFQQYYASIAPELVDERDEIDRRTRALPKHPTTLVLQERPPSHTRPTFLHHRGEFLQPKDPVEPGVPSFLPDLPPGMPPSRLAFAHWLVSPDNPLTARVVMNRHWQAFFGRGLVRTTEDFGFQGELPTHPELLDWLALEFVRRHWSLKQMHKLIVTSATYRQSSQVSPEALEKDPENIWLARGPRFRLDAEQVRDTALAVSGLLTSKIGGASVFPPQPANVTTEGAYGQLTWEVSEGPDRYRRSLYTFSKRTAPFAMYNTFDAPSGEACVARRDRSNTPLQSLTLLNDAMFLEAARALGRSAAGAADSHEARASRLFYRCVGRPPAREEVVELLLFYEKQRGRFASGELAPTELTGPNPGADPAEQAAWTAVARVLLNLDETITKS